MDKHLQRSVEFLIASVQNDFVRLPPLAHGLNTVCYEMIHNNYSRYLRTYQNLVSEIQELKGKKYRDELVRKTKQGYFDSLLKAEEHMSFWFEVTSNYYMENKYHGNLKRILSECREIIKLDSKLTKTRHKTKNNYQRS